MAEESERTLVLRAQGPALGRRDSAAFDQLVELHQNRVYAHCLSILRSAADAEDAAQETFVKAWRALPSFDPARPLAPWLYAIAARACSDALRKRRPQEEAVEELADASQNPLATILAAEQRGAVRDALRGLPAALREPLLLRAWHQLSYSEIGVALGIAEGAARVRVHRARARLTRALPDFQP